MKTISLYTALHITDVFHRTNEVIYLEYQQDKEHVIASVRRIKEAFNLQRTRVSKIRPWFSCGHYEGWIFTIQKGEK